MKIRINLAKVTSFVMLLTVIAMILVAGTYAKYSSQASGTDATVVAKWSFKVNGTEIAIKDSEPTVTFDLFNTINDTATGEEETDVADGLIAPGTTGSFEFVLLNSSEVTTKYAINLEIKEGSNVPLEFSLDGGNSWTKITELSDLVATDVMAIGSTKNVTVQWRWTFDGDTDAALGGETVKVTASVTATQVDKTSNQEEEIIMLNGDGQTYNTMAPSVLSFRSSANIEDFKEVKVNGETIDQSNYTMTEGSTIINLTIDYLKTLEENNYNISIVSKTGSPSAEFSVVEPNINNNNFYYNQPYTSYIANVGNHFSFVLHENGTIDIIELEAGSISYGTYTINENGIEIDSAFGNLTGTFSPDGMKMECNELLTNFEIIANMAASDEEFLYVYEEFWGGYKVNPINKNQSNYGLILSNINGIPVVRVDTNAFSGNTDLVNINLPSSIEIISSHAFSDNTNLTSINIPKSVTGIRANAFLNCTSLNEINFEGTISQWNSIDLGTGWNEGSSITTIKCSDGTITL